MLNWLYDTIYQISYPVLLIVTAVILAGGGLLHALASERVKRIVGTIGSAFILWVIIYSTLLMRTEEAGEIILQPGFSFQMAAVSYVYLRLVLMNIFLFVPFGMFISLAFSGRSSGRLFLITFLAGFIVTFTVELLQFIFRLGCAETDDIICNCLGTLIGFIPYLIVSLVNKRRSS